MSKQLTVRFFLANVFLLISFLAVEVAHAQVAVSVGVRETYDDNVFLESGVRRPNAFVLNDAIEQDLEDGQLSVLGGEPADGKEDSDLITNLNLAASGTLDDLSGALKGGWNIGTGLLLFTEYTDYSRVTMDALLNLSLKDSYIPKPFFATFNTGISSQTSDVSVANGSSARAAQTWNTSLRTGINNYEVASQTFLGAGYNVNYSKFLGEWVISGNRDERFEQQGSDFIANSLFATIDKQFTQSFNSGFSADSGIQTFTRVESNDAEQEKDKNDLDRYFTNLTWDSVYTVSNKLNFTSSIGVNITSFKNEPKPLMQTIINEDGEAEDQVLTRDKTQSGFIYTFGSTYAFEPGSSINLQVGQNRSTDIDGDLITVRNFSGTLNKSLGDRFAFTVGGTYLTFSTGDSVSSGLDRVEGTTSLSYALTQDTNLSIGYNYADQNSDDNNLTSDLLFQTQDYMSNRFYINISSGIIGKKS